MRTTTRPRHTAATSHSPRVPTRVRRPRTRRLVTIAPSLLLLLAATGTEAAASDLDPSFGSGGRVGVALDGQTIGYDLAVQPDGRIVGVGVDLFGLNDPVAFRLRPDGSVDPTFASHRLDEGGDDEAYAVALQPDGKVVLARWTDAATAAASRQDVAVWRLLPNGERDQTFGVDGLARFVAPADQRAEDVAVTPDGRIVVAGYNDADQDMAVFRFTPTGQPDTTFDGDGVIGFGGAAYDRALSVAVQDDGKVLVTGTNDSFPGLHAYRLTDTGRPDPTFGTAGRADAPGRGSAAALVLQPDGGVLVAGHELDGADTDAVVARFDSLGRFDPAYGGPGGARIELGAAETAVDIALLPGGDAVVVGSAGASVDVFVARLDAAGQATAFVDHGPLAVVRGVTAQPDGRYVLVGDELRTVDRPFLERFTGPTAPEPHVPPVPSPPTCHGRPATVVGTEGSDRLTGTPGADVVVALGGDDVVRGRGGDDLVCAGAGDDTVVGGPGRDRLYGERGADTMVGGSGRDRLVGGPDRDTTHRGGAA